MELLDIAKEHKSPIALVYQETNGFPSYQVADPINLKGLIVEDAIVSLRVRLLSLGIGKVHFLEKVEIDEFRKELYLGNFLRCFSIDERIQLFPD